VAQAEVPAGALITFLQKGLEYVGIEEHINEDGSIREFDGEYSLLSPFICEAIGIKEERRYKKLNPGPNTSDASATAPAAANESGEASGSSAEASGDAMDVAADAKESSGDLM
jgi:transducin (beta)-like 1